MDAQLVKEVAAKTNDTAGDGTTTATVLTQALVREGLKNIAAGANPIILRKGMKKAKEADVRAIEDAGCPLSRFIKPGGRKNGSNNNENQPSRHRKGWKTDDALCSAKHYFHCGEFTV